MLRPINHESVRIQPVTSRLRLQDAQRWPSRPIVRMTQINKRDVWHGVLVEGGAQHLEVGSVCGGGHSLILEQAASRTSGKIG